LIPKVKTLHSGRSRAEGGELLEEDRGQLGIEFNVIETQVPGGRDSAVVVHEEGLYGRFVENGGRLDAGHRLNAGVVAGGIFLVLQHRKGLVQSLRTVLVEPAEVPALEQGSGRGPAGVDLDGDGRVFGMGQNLVRPGVAQVVVVVIVGGPVRGRFITTVVFLLCEVAAACFAWRTMADRNVPSPAHGSKRVTIFS
jgi:hypothetical protein